MKVYVDECGTGAISGCAMTCAVAIPEDQEPPVKGINDSKQLTKQKREELFPILSKTLIHAYGASNIKKIKTLNLHYAKFLAMKEAIEKLLARGIKVEKVIVDGKFLIPNLNLPQEAVIKADEKYWEVGSASILAKVKRDELMAKLTKFSQFSNYKWESNAGYYTPDHRDGIIKYGASCLHRENHKYFQYSMFERGEFLKSKMSADEYIKWVRNFKKENGKSRYAVWLDSQKNKTGEINW